MKCTICGKETNMTARLNTGELCNICKECYTELRKKDRINVSVVYKEKN